jgi:hypothetical protein
MNLPRRRFLHLAAGAAALPSMSCFAWAQAYPTRPVRVIVAHRDLAIAAYGSGGAFRHKPPPIRRRHVREPRFDLAARPLLSQHKRAALIEADDVERILADVDAHHGNG